MMTTSETIRISPRDLGKMLKDDFCPFCYWHLIGVGFHPPFEMGMPGIMFNLDNFEKKLIEEYFESHGKLPKWLADLGCAEPITFPYKMTHEFPKYGLTLVGMPDQVLKKPDGSLYVIDYKTAQCRGDADPFMPCYETQLLGYVDLLESNDVGEISKAALVYFENRLADYKHTPVDLLTKDGFQVPFGVAVHPVEFDRDALPPLLRRFREYADMSAPPDGRANCENCEKLETMFNAEMLRRNNEKYLKKCNEQMRREITHRCITDQREARAAVSWAREEQAADSESMTTDSIPSAWDY